MRAILYLRQSLDQTGEQLGVQRQEAECRRLCEARGYDVADVIIDNSVSASKGDRPGWERLLAALEARTADVAVVYRLDRLLRRMTDLERLVELVDRSGAAVTTVQGEVDLGNSSGRLVARILASVARAEIETKSERHKLANAQKAAAGKPHGSRRPFGFEADLVTIRESEAALLREMARRVLAGNSCKDVAYYLNVQGHTTTQGKPWYAITVRNMLIKPRYAGIREYQGNHYKAVWPAVFDEVTWQRLQHALHNYGSGNSNLSGAITIKARKYLMTGFLYCGKCGKPLNGATKRDHPGRPLRRTYHCRVQGDTKREGGCGGVTRNADALDHFIAECVFYRLDTPTLSELLRPTDDTSAELVQETSSRRSAQVDRLNSLTDDYATGLLDRAQYARAKQTAETELRRIEQELTTMQRGSLAADILPAGETVRAAWQRGTDSWRRSLLSLLVARIDIQPGISKPFYEADGKRYRFDPSLVDIHWLA